MNTGEQLRNYQAANKKRTGERVEAAMRVIEAELEQHGYYPENRGRVTRKELCRRAGIGDSTLKNKTHKATAEMVGRWLARLRRSAPTLKIDADAAKQAQMSDLNLKLNQIAQNYNLFKIEYESLLKRTAALEEENAALKLRLAELHSDGDTVVALGAKRT